MEAEEGMGIINGNGQKLQKNELLENKFYQYTQFTLNTTRSYIPTTENPSTKLERLEIAKKL